MTTNQTIDGVPGLRELLERVATEANHMLGFTYAANYDECRAAVDELRALLDAPAVESELARMTRRCQNAELALKVQTENYEALKAAQPKGEPVAYRYKEGHASWENENPWVPTTLGHGEVLLGRKELAANGTFKGEERDHHLALVVEPLYAKQTAPVAAVLPERLKEIHEFLNGSGTLDGYSFGSLHPSGRKYWWRNELRACLDELKRPVHANPPPGTEPCGTHHDNDGLDEWRKP